MVERFVSGSKYPDGGDEAFDRPKKAEEKAFRTNTSPDAAYGEFWCHELNDELT